MTVELTFIQPVEWGKTTCGDASGSLVSCFMKRETFYQSRPLTLRPGDVAVGLQLCLCPGMSYPDLAEAVGVSLGQGHNAVRRLASARLVSQNGRAGARPRLLEFLECGVQYAFPAELGFETRGVPTAYGAPPLANGSPEGNVPVWPFASGSARGPAVAPLVPSAPSLMQLNPRLYELLALVDAIRIGRARDRKRAVQLLRQLLPENQGE